MARKKTKTSAALSHWLDTYDMREQFHISTGTLKKWRKMGLRFSKIANKLYFKDNDIETFMQEHLLNNPVA